MNLMTNWLSVPCSRSPKRSRNVYLAGKIRKNCWRHRLVSGLRDHTWSDGALAQDDFVYVGPFFFGCDHGCFHNMSSHGAIAARGDNLCQGRDVQSDFESPHHEVANLCLGTIEKANLLFCYIDSIDCYGTLVEIGYALAHDVPVVIAFSPGVASTTYNDFWFACVKACWVIYDVEERELPDYLQSARRPPIISSTLN